MIINLLINFVLLVFGAFFRIFPVVQLPDSVRSVLITAVGYWNSFMVSFPYAQIVWHCFIYVVIPFEVALLVFKFFLGHRLPAHLN